MRGLVDAFLELKDSPFHFRPGQILPFIHRFIDRVHNFCTPTHPSTLQTIVPTSAYPPHYRRPWLLGESFPPDAFGWYLLSQVENTRRVTSFQLSVWRTVRARLSTGFNGGEPWSQFKVPGPYPVPFWSSPIHLGLLEITMVQASVRMPTHRYLLAGVAWVDSRLTRFSSRFTVLRTSRHNGDEAVPCSPGGGDYTHRRTISCQGSHLAAHPPPGWAVSSERIALKYFL